MMIAVFLNIVALVPQSRGAINTYYLLFLCTSVNDNNRNGYGSNHYISYNSGTLEKSNCSSYKLHLVPSHILSNFNSLLALHLSALDHE